MKILVIGDSLRDVFLPCTTKGATTDTHVPIYLPSLEWDLPGGAAWAASCVRECGHEVDILTNQDVKVYAMVRKFRGRMFGPLLPASIKKRMIVDGKEICRIDEMVERHLSDPNFELFIDTLRNIFHEYDRILLSDYGSPIFTSDERVTRTIDIIRDHPFVYVNGRNRKHSVYNGAHYLQLCFEDYNFSIHQDFEGEYIVTMGDEGAYYVGEVSGHVPTIKVEDGDWCGAGDTLAAHMVTSETINIESLKEAVVKTSQTCAVSRLERFQKIK